MCDTAIQHDLQGDCTNSFSRFFICGSCKQVHRITLGCHRRFDSLCPSCAKKWRIKMRNKYRHGINNMRGQLRFLTLTLYYQKTPLDMPANNRLNDLWHLKNEFFHILRNRINERTGKPYYIGAWCGCMEPPNHLHIVFEGDWIPQHEMVEIWQSLTGDSFIVDIRPVDSPGRASHYVTKYITKTKEWEEFGFDFDRLKSLRICQSWGLDIGTVPDRESICPCGKKDLHPTYTSEYYCDLPIICLGDSFNTGPPIA